MLFVRIVRSSVSLSRFTVFVVAFTTLWTSTSNAVGPDEGTRPADFTLSVLAAGSDFAAGSNLSKRSLNLREQHSDGPIVVVVLRGYPGYQCPICQRQVSSLINRSRGLTQLAKRIILVYPGPANDLERRGKQFIGSRRLPKGFVLVGDPGYAMVTSWDLRWNAPRETAYPSTLVIDQSGLVTWKKISTSHGERSSADDIVRQLRKVSRDQ